MCPVRCVTYVSGRSLRLLFYDLPDYPYVGSELRLRGGPEQMLGGFICLVSALIRRDVRHGTLLATSVKSFRIYDTG